MTKKEPGRSAGKQLGSGSSVAGTYTDVEFSYISKAEAEFHRAVYLERAKKDFDKLKFAPDVKRAAKAFCEEWPDYCPDYFHPSDLRARVKARKALGNGEGWPCRLLGAVKELAHHSYHTRHLELPESAADGTLLFDRTNIDLWKRAIKENFKGPLRWKLELGKNSHIHIHLLADLWDGPSWIPRGGEVVKPCEGYFERVVIYHHAPSAPYTPETLALWLEAKKRGSLPHLCGTMRLPNKVTWHQC